jgi:hypothetical protein
VENSIDWSVPGGDVPKDLVDRVDAAYPFQARTGYAYKAWLAERRLFREALLEENPTQDEYDVCCVAADMVEEGRPREALALLDEQAPNRLGRRCPACGSRKARACREPVVDDETKQQALFRNPPSGLVTKFVDRIVPCRARILPRVLTATGGETS